MTRAKRRRENIEIKSLYPRGDQNNQKQNQGLHETRDTNLERWRCRMAALGHCATFRCDSPKPAHTLAAINQPTDGAAEETAANEQFTVREKIRHLRLPSLSAALPANIPPISIPTNTAAVSNSAELSRTHGALGAWWYNILHFEMSAIGLTESYWVETGPTEKQDHSPLLYQWCDSTVQ